MSLLWRAAISNLDFYKDVNLNNCLVELLREKLCMLQPLEPNEIPCFMERVFIDPPVKSLNSMERKQSKAAIFSPIKITLQNLDSSTPNPECVTLLFGRFQWRFWLHTINDYFVN